MTLEQIKSLDSVMITPAQAAEVLGSDPQWIRIAAREKPHLLGFPVTVIGNRVKIPRLPFVKFMEG